MPAEINPKLMQALVERYQAMTDETEQTMSDRYPGIPQDFPFSPIHPLPGRWLEYMPSRGATWRNWPKDTTAPSPIRLVHLMALGKHSAGIDICGMPNFYALRISNWPDRTLWYWLCSTAEWTKAPETECAPLADPVNHPPHYTQGAIECIDAMEAAGTPAEFVGYCRLAAFKYLWRMWHKGSALENLRKARWYIDRAIQVLEKES